MQLRLLIKIINISILLILCSNIYGQKIQILTQGIESDSSFYCVQKINENEYWVGGEFGILKKIDTLGNISSLDLPSDGIDILKIKRINNFVFIITSNAVIYRYDILRDVFIKKEFSQFKDKCFYDLVESANGDLLVCGGASGIAKGEKVIPKGFIATVNKDLTEIKIVWKCYRKFVWSLLEDENQKIVGFTFNGLNTTVIKSDNLIKWKKELKIKGLVHNSTLVDTQMWYCGSKSIRFQESGIMGTSTKKQNTLNKTGCLWSLASMNEKVIAVTQSGKLLKIDKKTQKSEQIKTPTFFTLYDIAKISDSKMLIAGHGKTLYIIEFTTNF